MTDSIESIGQGETSFLETGIWSHCRPEADKLVSTASCVPSPTPRRLTKTAAAGSNTIEVLNPGDWKKGEQIVVASTDFDPHQAEERTIASVSGKVITLDQ